MCSSKHLESQGTEGYQVQGIQDYKGRPNGGTMNPDSLAVIGTRVGGPIQEPRRVSIQG